MKRTIATAPGKAVLSGEYVVLEDAAAIAAAVDRRARATVADADADCHVISAPGYLPGKWSFTRGEEGELAWQEPLPRPSAFSLVEAVSRSVGNAGWPTLSIEIDTRRLCDTGTGVKLGLGSSAAVAVALTAALQRACPVECDSRELAFDAHDRFQRGSGSGVDVATSLEGGLLRYRRDGRESRRLRWPEGLCYRYLWSGRPAVTADKLASVAGPGGKGHKSQAFNLLAEHAEKVASAWSHGDPGGVLASYPAYIDALKRFSADHDLGIFDAGHGDLVRQASDSSLVYKPCGAGAGDIGIVLAACEHDINEFCEQARERGFRNLDIATDPKGVQFAE